MTAAGRAAPRPGPLAAVLGPTPPPFALLHRPEANGPGVLDVLIGEVSTPATLADVPLRAHGPRRDTLVLVPFRQLAERGFAAPDDGAPLIALTVAEEDTVPVSEALEAIGNEPIRLGGGAFDVDDAAYADIVRRVIADEIGQGVGANFVIKRSFTARIEDFGPRSALTLFRRLVEQETGGYWTFVVHTGERTFVGASPERHISVRGGTAVMNPISGTYRYPPTGPTLPEVMAFLADRKEADELYMVVDEELKMMARVCEDGGRVTGPHLKEMARLAHTEYFIEGRTDRDPREVLRETLFAPTVTGSPLESAARVISRYEPEGRGYYSGVVALIGRDDAGARELDSAILIRTADIDAAGRVRIGVGATLVRHSDPDSEVAETRAKAAGLIAALRADGPARFADHPEVRSALTRRNDTIAEFWLADAAARARPQPALSGTRVLVVDAEDTFTSMIGHQLRSLGPTVTVRRFDEPYDPDGYDLVVMGPGPGDPRDVAHPKIAHLRGTILHLLAARRPFLAVCLSHQVLARELGFPLVRREVPNQGRQREIDLFGVRKRVGFYNTFAARADASRADVPGLGTVEVSRDPAGGEVHALRGPGFASVQFHPESVLTQDGIRIFGSLLAGFPGGDLTEKEPVASEVTEKAEGPSLPVRLP
ncbi:anthranilate synthase family protein [Streptomyces marincola]|uniref:anthranilate synthase family protein n=1 Tax=Streptomyces marincola TaxID=2878388 RepID=UPI00298F411B|nr:anthranilate synthase family protein [Streptomyces marincola]